MIFYHGTTEENWKKIQAEGVLWGIPTPMLDRKGKPYKLHRYTYLSPHMNVAEAIGNVILEVEYEPVGIDGTGTDNYGFNPPKGQTCWQFSVFIPIPLKKVKRYERGE